VAAPFGKVSLKNGRGKKQAPEKRKEEDNEGLHGPTDRRVRSGFKITLE